MFRIGIFQILIYRRQELSFLAVILLVLCNCQGKEILPWVIVNNLGYQVSYLLLQLTRLKRFGIGGWLTGIIIFGSVFGKQVWAMHIKLLSYK